MKWLLMVLVVSFWFASLASPLCAVTYYVRTDGGTADQCTGTTDAAYPGSGTNQPCAWSHPFWALNNNGSWKIQGGDTLLIYAGSYQMGFGAPNTSGWCSPESAWDCYLPPLPSGPNPLNPTYIFGKGWDSGCPNPPELWGTQRTNNILNLTNTSNAVIDCLELTDHSGCVEGHSNTSIACQSSTFPFGEWALKGIYAADSSNVILRHLNIHGLAHTGIHAGRLTDWTLEDVRIAGNGMAGWDGDIDGSDSNSGTLAFRRLTIEWNGCAESYPAKQPNNCWAQTAGGYGDGFGQGGETGGHWIIEDSIIRYNTSDGIDILYARGDSQIEIKRTKSYGNAGDQVKVTGSAKIENSLIVSNCGYFNGKSFTYNVDNCRAGGSALVFALGQGNEVSVVNSTLAGHGDCLTVVECHPNLTCNGTESVIVLNNIFQGFQEFIDPNDTTCYSWFDRENYYQIQMDYNIIHNAKQGVYPPIGSHDILQAPLFVNANLETFDGHLQSGSPAIDTGLPVGSLNGLIPSNDLTSATRPYGSGVDKGVYEYGAIFSDVPPSHWALNYIISIYNNRITFGCAQDDDNTTANEARYCPEDSVTRGQMAAFIIRAKYGEDFSYTTTPYFTDVPSTHTFFKYVQKLRDDGITAVSGTYAVDSYVTRGQMAAFIIRAKYGESFSYTTTPYFSDVPSTHNFFKYVQKLKDAGITAVTGTYGVDDIVNRAQMAAFLARAFLGME